MVVVGVDAHGLVELGGRHDADAVGRFRDFRAQFAQFGGHGGDAVGFFYAPAGNIAQAAGAAAGQGDHGQGHRRIRDVVGIQIKRQHRLAFGTRHFDKVVAPQYAGADFFQLARKRHIALNAVAADAAHPHRAAAEQAGGQKIRRAGGIALHMYHRRGMVNAVFRQPEDGVILIVYLHAETCH